MSMTGNDNNNVAALTEKEKQTLRLMVRGHDAKSIARSQGLSVHTINERLRDARRKLAVSSSREAARLLLDAEQQAGANTPENVGDGKIGEAADHAGADEQSGRTSSRPRLITGVLLMSLVLGLLALAFAPEATPPTPAPTSSQDAADRATVATARRFLELIDASQWDDSYAMTGTRFQTMNSVAVWAKVSEEARPPLGALLSARFSRKRTCPPRRTGIGSSGSAPTSPTKRQ